MTQANKGYAYLAIRTSKLHQLTVTCGDFASSSPSGAGNVANGAELS
jgi:hypothetical protein